MSQYQMYFLVGLICYLNIYQTVLLLQEKDLHNVKIKIGVLWLFPIVGWLYIIFFKDSSKNIIIKSYSNSNILSGEVKYNTVKYFSLFFAIIIYGYIFILLG